MAALQVVCLLAIAGQVLGQPRTTKLVSVDLIATDERGRRVSDLRADEIRVTDNGKRQEVVYFRRGEDVTPPQSSLDGARSNHGRGTFPHATAILFDQFNTRMELTGRQWDQMVRAIAKAEEAHDLYLYVLLKNGALYPVRGLPESWVDAAPQNGPWTRELLPQFDDMRREYRERPMEFDPRKAGLGPEAADRLKSAQLITESALQDIATRLAAVPGARSIVWIGGHVAGESHQPVKNPTGRIRRTTGELLDSVPIYYVAAGSLIGAKDDPITPPTGPSIEQAVAAALADSQRGYRVGYLPPETNWDGRRHSVRIVCARPGVRIHGGMEYDAVRPVDVADDLRQMRPDLVAASPFDAATIRFRVVARAGQGPLLRVNAADVFFARVDEQYSASLVALGIVYHEDGSQDALPEPVRADLKLTQAEREAAVRDGIPIQLPAAACSAGDRVRIVALDRGTQSFGTLTVPCGGVN